MLNINDKKFPVLQYYVVGTCGFDIYNHQNTKKIPNLKDLEIE